MGHRFSGTQVCQCGKKIATNATTCPWCGHTYPSNTLRVTVILVSLLALIAVIVVTQVRRPTAKPAPTSKTSTHAPL